MATEEELNNQRDLNSEITQTKSLEEQIIDLLSKRRGINSDVLSDQQDISNVLQDQVKQQQFLISEKKLARDISNQVTKIAQVSYSITKDELGLSKTNTSILKQQEALEKNIILAKQQQGKFSEMSNQGDIESRRLNAEIARSLGDQAKQAKEIARQLAQTAESSNAIANSGGVKAFGLMGDVAGKLGMSKMAGPVKEAAEAARAHGAEQIEMNAGINKGIGDYKQFRAEGMKMGDAMKKAGVSAKQVKVGKLPLKATGTLQAGFKALGPILKKAMGPLALIVEAVQAFIQVDKAAGETAKSMGISAAEGGRLNAKMADAAAMSGDLLVSSKDVVAANMELNKLLGTSVEFSGELASEFASVKERTGLSEKAMGMFTKNAMAAGTTIKDQLQEVTAITQEMSAQSGIMLNSKDIQEGIAEMSAVQQLNAGRSTEEMAKQVFQAKLLGASQSQLESASSSLLDFESSIGAEMEAELLTGKQLNLEAARAAALAGDQGKLAEELAKNMGTSAEFGAMNVLQQEKMAAAMGMTKEDMAGMLIEQENLEKIKEAGFASASDAQEKYNAALKDGTLTEELKADLAKAGVLNQMESATQADKLAAVMEKITDLFVQIVDPLMPLVDALMAILDPIFDILSPIMKLIGDLVGLVVSVLMPAFNFLMTPIKAVLKAINTIGTSIKSIFGGLGDFFTGIFTLDGDMILSGFKSIVNGIVSFMIMPFQLLTDLVVGALNYLIEGINLIPMVDIPLIPSPNLAGMVALAEGGVVTGPTQALIGEGSEAEAVLPLSKLASMLPSGVAIGDSILNAATAPMRGIMNTIGSIFDQGDIGDALQNPISGLMDTIGGMFDGDSIIDKVSNVATAPLRGIMDTVGGLFGNEDLGDIIKNPISGLMDTVGGMFDGGSSPVSVLSDAVGSIFDNDIGDTLLKTITAPMRAVGNLIPSEGVSSAISSFEEDPTGSIGSVFNNVKEGISNILGGDDENKDNEQLKSLNEKMSQLISLIEKGGDVYIDGAKAGKSMVLATSRMG